jgi:pimeloyl-ACP methyl ester carboxylesterase
MQKTLGVIAVAAAAALGGAGSGLAYDASKPTIVLVHGAFADSSGWNGVIEQLNKNGYKAIAASNPLRSLSGDAAAVQAVVKSIPGDVVLVGHSYGGLVISAAADGQENVKALVYVAAFIPEVGESAFSLSTKFPGSTLGDALQPVPLADGNVDLYIQPTRFHAQFAADVPQGDAILMAQTQRPVTQAALEEQAPAAAWKAIPSWLIYGELDLNIPAAVEAFSADRAKVQKAVEIKGGSHALMVSHPAEVAAMIEEAATTRVD